MNKKLLLATSAILLSVPSLAIANGLVLDSIFAKVKKQIEVKKADVKASSYTEVEEDDLKKGLLHDVRSVVAKSPNVIVGYGYGAYSIRGIQNSSFTYGKVGYIGYEKDGVSYDMGSRSSVGDNSWDIKKVTIFKGAQLASYDTPSMAGMISVESNKPHTEKREQKSKIEFSQYGGLKLGYVLNQPLNSKTAVRLSAYSEKSDGPVKYDIKDGDVSGSFVQKASELNNKSSTKVDEKSYKIQVLSNLNNGGSAEILLAKDISKSDRWIVVDDLEKLKTNRPYDDQYNNDMLTIAGKVVMPVAKDSAVTFKVSNVETNIDTDYSWQNYRCWTGTGSSADDVSGAVPADGNCTGGTVKKNTLEQANRVIKIERFNTSVRYDKIMDKDKFRLTGSLSMLESSNVGDVQYAQYTGKTYPRYKTSHTDTTDTYSVYGLYEKTLSEKVVAIFGGRAVIDEVSMSNQLSQKKHSKSEKNILPSFGLEYKHNPTTTIGLSVKKGYSRGGVSSYYNNAYKEIIVNYNAEKMWDYNLKISKVLGKNTMLNASVFKTKWTNKQETRYTSNMSPYIVNAGSGYSQGIEASVKHKLTKNLATDLSVGLLKSKYESGSNKGKEFAGAPKTTINADFTYTDVYKTNPYYVNTNISYVGKHKDTYSYTTHLTNPAVTTVNLKAGFTNDNKHWYIGVVNLFNKRPYSQRFNSNGVYKNGHISDYYVNPKNIARTLFVGVDIDF